MGIPGIRSLDYENYSAWSELFGLKTATMSVNEQSVTILRELSRKVSGAL